MPPDAYGVPISERAAEMAEPPPPPPAGAGALEPEMPIALIVAGPTTPSTSSPLRAWNAFTAARVCGPKAPSAEIPSWLWMADTAGPREPCSRRLELLAVAVGDVVL